MVIKDAMIIAAVPVDQAQRKLQQRVAPQPMAELAQRGVRDVATL
jgi:hypothetical protein